VSEVLVHICCGICASECVQRLKEEGFRITGFFYNPNIYPESEYERRLEITRRVSEILEFELLEGDYDKERWSDLIKGFESELEGRNRCQICFKMRLNRTQRRSKELDTPYFTTTLTVSPYKDSQLINDIGKSIDKFSFLERDFKERGGFKRAIEFSKTYNLYRQNYCGCMYSRR